MDWILRYIKTYLYFTASLAHPFQKLLTSTYEIAYIECGRHLVMSCHILVDFNDSAHVISNVPVTSNYVGIPTSRVSFKLGPGICTVPTDG